VTTFSALIITHGREELLLKCLNSLRPQGPNWQLILVANGEVVSDEVKKLANEICEDVHIVDIEQKVLAGEARNIGLEYVKGEWVFFLDDDAYLIGNYFDHLVPLLTKEGIDVIGGPDAPAKNMNSWSEALAIALASPFCTGKTFLRHSSQGKMLKVATEETLTSCNLWVRTHWLKEIKFPENYKRAEENVLLVQLKNAGAHLYHHPLMKVAHFRRKSLLELIRPIFDSGFFRSKLMREFKTAGSSTFWLPSIFVLSHLLAFISLDSFIYLFKLYLAVIFMMSLNLCSRRRKMSLFFHVIILHYWIVFIYGLGFLANRLGLYGHHSRS